MRLRTLTAQTDFQKIYESGQKQVSRSFVLFFRPGPEFRYAVVASRKTIGIAVKRNRAKRILRVLVASGNLGDRLAGDLVVVARANLLVNKLDSLKEELEKCLKNWQLA